MSPCGLGMTLIFFTHASVSLPTVLINYGDLQCWLVYLGCQHSALHFCEFCAICTLFQAHFSIFKLSVALLYYRVRHTIVYLLSFPYCVVCLHFYVFLLFSVVLFHYSYIEKLCAGCGSRQC